MNELKFMVGRRGAGGMAIRVRSWREPVENEQQHLLRSELVPKKTNLKKRTQAFFKKANDL